MKTRFTKGEWSIQVAETDTGRDSFEVVTDDYDICCHRFGIRSEHDVNLIKTAPKLYAMLESVISEIHCLIDEVNDQRASYVNMSTENEPDYYDMQTLHEIQLLLAEARGE